MKAIGTYTQPSGAHGMDISQKYYAIRYNHKCGTCSHESLGMQILILFLGDYLWINIKPEWLD